jgi:hypothetical protein
MGENTYLIFTLFTKNPTAMGSHPGCHSETLATERRQDSKITFLFICHLRSSWRWRFILVYDTAECNRLVPRFRRNILTPSSVPLWKNKYGNSETLVITIRLQCFITHETEIWKSNVGCNFVLFRTASSVGLTPAAPVISKRSVKPFVHWRASSTWKSNFSL